MGRGVLPREQRRGGDFVRGRAVRAMCCAFFLLLFVCLSFLFASCTDRILLQLPSVDPGTGIRDKVVPDRVLRPFREGLWAVESDKVFFGVNALPKRSSTSISPEVPLFYRL